LLDEVGSSAPLFCEKEEEQMARSRQAYPLAVALVVGVVLSLSIFLLVFFGISGGSVSAQEEPATDPVLVGAGDIASCKSTGDEATANLLDGIAGTVATFGDNAYDSGTSTEFANCYEPSWGRHKAHTMPSAGNHEYNTAGATGYFDYFGAAAGDPQKGYYSYDLGSWHVVVLNSNCAKVAGGCVAGSPQEQWLRADLDAHLNTCTAAYFHHPRFSSAGNNSAMGPFWKALYDEGADVVLAGHRHNYERFAPQNPSGQADPAQGIRQFVVGTGGKSLNAFTTVQPPNSEVRSADAFGVIKLTLHPEGYDWQFVPVEGETFTDSGSGQCHGAPSSPPTDDTTAPTVISTVPDANATGVDPAANVKATFSEDMMASSINGQTFKLFKKGSTTKLSATVSYDSDTDTATLVPSNPLQGGVTYKAVVTTKATDLAGNPLDQDSTTTGLQKHKWFFTVS
jgi:hypothetical protein